MFSYIYMYVYIYIYIYVYGERDALLGDSCSVLIRSGLNLAPWSTFECEGPRPANNTTCRI